ncbi:MAG: hypothetical protein LC804_03460 [Acidobacteria bacterium]|nr:hypothetical protein [Acidobacteriota bacterium]
MFKPILQEYNSTTTMIARSSRAADDVAAEMGQIVAQLDPGLPVYGAGSIRRMLGFALFPNRAAALALGAFGAMALALAATGLYGLVSYSVARRAREIGIRMAIGAGGGDILRVILRRTAALLVIGSAAGGLLAFLGGGLLVSVVYQASPYDPAVFAAVAVTMFVVGIISAWGPATRALRISPVSALKAE